MNSCLQSTMSISNNIKPPVIYQVRQIQKTKTVNSPCKASAFANPSLRNSLLEQNLNSDTKSPPKSLVGRRPFPQIGIIAPDKDNHSLASNHLTFGATSSKDQGIRDSRREINSNFGTFSNKDSQLNHAMTFGAPSESSFKKNSLDRPGNNLPIPTKTIASISRVNSPSHFSRMRSDLIEYEGSFVSESQQEENGEAHLLDQNSSKKQRKFVQEVAGRNRSVKRTMTIQHPTKKFTEGQV